MYVYYAIAEDTSSTFVKASSRYIIPGIYEMIQMKKQWSKNTQKEGVEELIKEIAHYSKEAQMKIHNLVEEV